MDGQDIQDVLCIGKSINAYLRPVVIQKRTEGCVLS